jgi:N-acyl-D-aspartate/D-glutamate deacylase
VQLRAFAVSLTDLEQFMKQDYTAVCTDRRGDSPELRKDRFVHPGTFGTSTRLIRTFALDKKVITLPFAIRALTSLPAQIVGLRDRGRLPRSIESRRSYVTVGAADCDLSPRTPRFNRTKPDVYPFAARRT